MLTRVALLAAFMALCVAGFTDRRCASDLNQLPQRLSHVDFASGPEIEVPQESAILQGMTAESSATTGERQ